MLTDSIAIRLFLLINSHPSISIARYMLGAAPPRRVRYRDGLVLAAPPGASPIYIHREIFANKVYDSPLCAVEPGDVVVDIGGNVGIFTLYACNKGAKSVHVYEPMPENAYYLARNLKDNGCTQVQLTACAVGAEEGMETMVVSDHFGGHIVGAKKDRIGGKAEITVSITTLERILDDNGLETVDFLKLDCEGSEGAILQASLHLLPRIRKIAMEFHDRYSILNHEEILTLLEEAEFETALKWDGFHPEGNIYAARC